jgi:hypothetical protein
MVKVVKMVIFVIWVGDDHVGIWRRSGRVQSEWVFTMLINTIKFLYMTTVDQVDGEERPRRMNGYSSRLPRLPFFIYQ